MQNGSLTATQSFVLVAIHNLPIPVCLFTKTESYFATHVQ